MILIGQYDSPFVRRVGIALTLYGLPFEHRPWSAFGDADKIRPYNPLTRVPTLVLDDGEVLIESHMMLDYLDSLVPAERRMFPASRAGPASGAQGRGAGDRPRPTRPSACSTRRRLHEKVSDLWVEPLPHADRGVLAVLEADRAGRHERLLVRRPHRPCRHRGGRVLRFIGDAHPGLVSLADFPALEAHAARMEALPVFPGESRSRSSAHGLNGQG